MRPNMNKLSEEEGSIIKTIFDAIVDVIVKKTGGKPTFGGDK